MQVDAVTALLVTRNWYLNAVTALLVTRKWNLQARYRHLVVDPAGSLTPRPLGRPAERHDEFGRRGTLLKLRLSCNDHATLAERRTRHAMRQLKQSLP